MGFHLWLFLFSFCLHCSLPFSPIYSLLPSFSCSISSFQSVRESHGVSSNKIRHSFSPIFFLTPSLPPTYPLTVVSLTGVATMVPVAVCQYESPDTGS